MRCFIAVELPVEIRKEIKKIQDRLPEFKGKKTELENIHLTLKFLGEISEKEVELAKEGLRSINLEKFKIKINKLGVFSEKFIRIIWVGANSKDEESKKLWELQKEIDARLEDLFEKERRFMGHITIARVKQVKDKKKFLEEIEKIKVNLTSEIENFKLIESILKSEGPEYKIIEEFKLK